jgi:hypothetical protein
MEEEIWYGRGLWTWCKRDERRETSKLTKSVEPHRLIMALGRGSFDPGEEMLDLVVCFSQSKHELHGIRARCKTDKWRTSSPVDQRSPPAAVHGCRHEGDCNGMATYMIHYRSLARCTVQQQLVHLQLTGFLGIALGAAMHRLACGSLGRIFPINDSQRYCDR